MERSVPVTYQNNLISVQSLAISSRSSFLSPLPDHLLYISLIIHESQIPPYYTLHHASGIKRSVLYFVSLILLYFLIRYTSSFRGQTQIVMFCHNLLLPHVFIPGLKVATHSFHKCFQSSTPLVLQQSSRTRTRAESSKQIGF